MIETRNCTEMHIRQTRGQRLIEGQDLIHSLETH